ncbi:phage portal protein [Geomicrobium sp. JCM 19055]|uniref:phage portal protein n=1 Tax=Geomicrobium sp. JCM 19055 TaxID=1460649 RepID=UPI00045ECC2C|nr:phage portal protein [Geomicrobium sp. JCM 19055]GAK01496.1 phage portal protein [Geomicrobium sp. JCM 19055]
MYPEGSTLTEEYVDIIKRGGDVGLSEMVQKLIEEHDASRFKEGERYYFNEGDIKQRQKQYYKDGELVEDESKANHKNAHGWHKLLVDQKVAYLVSKPIVVESESDYFMKRLDDFFGDFFNDMINESVKNASNKGVEYWHPYIDEEGNLDYLQVPPEQLIPIYDYSNPRQPMEAALRYYQVSIYGEKVIRAEWWERDKVTYLISGGGTFTLDPNEEVNPAPHYYYDESGYAWERVPFIPFRNNQEEKSDLTFYKDLVDDYDRLASDGSNNFEEIQELIYVLKGFDGTNLSEFLTNLKHYKVIKTDGDGGVDTKKAEIPMESLETKLNRTQDDIVAFGMGVNPKQDAFGSNPSGVSLKFLYSLLDMKASTMERKFTSALKQLVWFIKEYLAIADNHTFEEKIKFTFNKTMIFNENESIDNSVKSAAVTSLETALSNHPWVTDVEAEKKKIQEEREKMRDPYHEDLNGYTDHDEGDEDDG